MNRGWRVGEGESIASRVNGQSIQTGTDKIIPHLAALTAYGNAVGLMFQIVDDLLDVEQTTEQLGKRAGKDEQAGKLTFPGLLGVAESRVEVDRLRSIAHAALAPMAPDAAGLADLCEYLAVRTK